MLDWLIYFIKLSLLKIRKAFLTIIFQYYCLRSECDRKYNEPWRKWNNELGIVRDKISYLVSEHLISQAIKCRLPFPSEEHDEERYVSLDFTKKSVLSYDAELELRRKIRAERRDRSELALRWMASVTGLIGALIGLLAIILGRR